MPSTVKFKLSDLPPHLRMQAERQLAASSNPRLKPQPPKPSAPIRLPKPRTPNKTELRYVNDYNCVGPLYEALSFKVPSGRYTPDWVEFRKDGSIVCVEVKGGHAFGSQAAASAKFKEAVATYPAVTWIWAKWDGKTWHVVSSAPENPRTIDPRA